MMKLLNYGILETSNVMSISSRVRITLLKIKKNKNISTFSKKSYILAIVSNFYKLYNFINI